MGCAPRIREPPGARGNLGQPRSSPRRLDRTQTHLRTRAHSGDSRPCFAATQPRGPAETIPWGIFGVGSPRPRGDAARARWVQSPTLGVCPHCQQALRCRNIRDNLAAWGPILERVAFAELRRFSQARGSRPPLAASFEAPGSRRALPRFDTSGRFSAPTRRKRVASTLQPPPPSKLQHT